MRRLPVVLLALTVAGTAQAGGIGILGTGGIRTQNVYYYDANDSMDQYRLVEGIGGVGAGVEVILGDRDDRLTGVFRGYWLRELPEVNPADLSPEIPADDVIANVREEPRDVGVAMVGLDWSFLGDPENVAMSALALVGSGFLTTDHTEYFQFEIGPGFHWEFARRARLTANVNYQLRFRKGFMHGASGYVGVRYLFD